MYTVYVFEYLPSSEIKNIIQNHIPGIGKYKPGLDDQQSGLLGLFVDRIMIGGILFPIGSWIPFIVFKRQFTRDKTRLYVQDSNFLDLRSGTIG